MSICAACARNENFVLLLPHTRTNIMQDGIIHPKTRVNTRPPAQLFRTDSCVCARRYRLSTCIQWLSAQNMTSVTSFCFWVPIVLCTAEIYAAVLSCDWLALPLCLSNSASMSDFRTTVIFTSIIYEHILAVSFPLKIILPLTLTEAYLPQHKIQGTLNY